MSAETIRVGIIGAGGNTRSRHIPGLQAIEGVEVSSVCNRSIASSQRVADEFGIRRIHATWMDTVEDPALDAICIGTWPYLHCRATVAALEAGKHVMCEARMAMNADEARVMLQAAQANRDLVAQIVPSPMTLKVDAMIKKLIADGALGEILAIEIRAGAGFLDRDAPLTWRQDMDLSGLNVMSMGIWYEAVMRWVGEATEVSAMGRTFAKMRAGEDGSMTSVRIPEHVDVVAEMACGAQMHVQCSSVTGHAGPNEVFIFGSEGTLRLSGDELTLGGKDDDGLVPVEIPDDLAEEWRVEEEFIGAIRGTESIRLTTFEDGVKYMEFTEAVARSMADRRTVTLSLGLG